MHCLKAPTLRKARGRALYVLHGGGIPQRTPASNQRGQEKKVGAVEERGSRLAVRLQSHESSAFLTLHDQNPASTQLPGMAGSIPNHTRTLLDC